MKEKMKSWVFWSSLVAQILSILVMTNIIDVGLSDAINGIIGTILQMFVVFGVLNNPNERGSF